MAGLSTIPIPWVRRLLLGWQWRQTRKRGRTLRLRVGPLEKFFERLHNADVRYAVLRWFDEVPLGPNAKGAESEDVDVLVDAFHVEKLVQAASKFPGATKMDVYTPTGRKATAFKKMPYYPPVLAEEILQGRDIHLGGFWVPNPEMHFKSLAFHLVYHKGLESGIPSGTELTGETQPKRDYAACLQALGMERQVPLKQPYTLLSLHEYLRREQWAMPHDLMMRWPQQHAWLRWLAKHEENAVTAPARALPNLIVFLLRADALEPVVREKASAMLSAKFQLLREDTLNEAQIRRVMRQVRGGNWVEHKKTTLVEPRVALICHDPQPQPLSEADPRRSKYPFVSNANILFKEEVRDQLNALFPIQPERIAIHGSDNAVESQHYLQAIYGQEYPRVCQELEQALAPVGKP